MISKQQAEIAREFTKSTLCTAAMNLEIQDTPTEVKIEICHDIDAILQEDALEFDKAFPSILSRFLLIATNANIDPASLYCIYVERKKS